MSPKPQNPASFLLNLNWSQCALVLHRLVEGVKGVRVLLLGLLNPVNQLRFRLFEPRDVPLLLAE